MTDPGNPSWNVQSDGEGDRDPVGSDDRAQAMAAGEIKPLNRQIELSEYDPTWPDLFDREAARIHAALGEAVVQLEHVGSTSIPGIVAKPRIDILLIVPDSSNEAAYVAPMETAGYVLRIREADWHEHRLFKGPDTDTNIHVFSPGCSEIERLVGFRDWLRSHAPDRELYAAAKRDLAARTWHWVQDYADAKTAVVEEIISRAGLPGPLADGGTR